MTVPGAERERVPVGGDREPARARDLGGEGRAVRELFALSLTAMDHRARFLTLAIGALLAGGEAGAQNWMHWPVDRATAARARLTQGFYGDYIAYCGGRAGCGTHNGYDVAMGVGTPLYAVAPGVVDAVNPRDARTADYGNAGLWVRVRHDGGTVPGLAGTFFVTYMHLSQVDVPVGARVTTTTRVGLSGNSGGVGAHLHLHLATGTNYCGAPVDPGCPTPAYVRGSVVSAAFLDAPGCQSVCRPVTVQWVQPAAYGNEPYARAPAPGCGALDYRGRCDGETLHWCMDGAPQEADCLARGGVCAWQNDTEGYNCLRCDPALMRPLLPGARCEGTRFVRCDGTRPVSDDCANGGRTCTPSGCVAPTPPDDAAADAARDAPGDPADVPGDLPFFDGPGTAASDGGFEGPASDAQTADDARVGMDGGADLDASRSGCGCRGGPGERATVKPLGVASALAVLCRLRRRRRRWNDGGARRRRP